MKRLHWARLLFDIVIEQQLVLTACQLKVRRSFVHFAGHVALRTNHEWHDLLLRQLPKKFGLKKAGRGRLQ